MLMTLTITHAIISFFLVVFVLLQFGKGAEAGIFSGGGGEVFSGSQSGNILTTITTVLVILFLGLSVTLSAMRSNRTETSNVFDAKEVEPAIDLQMPSQGSDADAGKSEGEKAPEAKDTTTQKAKTPENTQATEQDTKK